MAANPSRSNWNGNAGAFTKFQAPPCTYNLPSATVTESAKKASTSISVLLGSGRHGMTLPLKWYDRPADMEGKGMTNPLHAEWWEWDEGNEAELAKHNIAPS